MPDTPGHYTDGSTDGPAHYTDRTADPLTAALAAMGEKNERWIAHYGFIEELMADSSFGDVRKLLVLAAALLDGHSQISSVRLEPCAEHEHWRGPLVGDNDNLAVRLACPACRVFDDSWCCSCVGGDGRYRPWPCQPYKDACEALGIAAPIGGALLGEETAGG
jgi:hypothetical protein